MKTIKIIPLVIILIFNLACEEVIQIDLNSTNPAIVIEAKIYDKPDSNGFFNRIDITKSTDFYQPGIYPTIDDATISITDNLGNSYNVSALGDGVYNAPNLIGEIGKTYRIEVNAENQNYSAVSNLPNSIEIDTIYYERRPTFGGKSVILLHVGFYDNPDEENFAKLKIFIENKPQPNYGLYNDRLSNGNYFDGTLFVGLEGEDINFGESIRVEIQAIDANVYEYFQTLRKVQANANGGGNQIAPANPITNWDNNAFGYFAAFSVVRDSIDLGF